MSGSTGQGTRWSLPFNGARGDSLTPQTAGHNRCNPWRTPVRTISAFRGEPSDPLARTHSLAANPAPAPSSYDGVRTPNPATDMQPLTRLTKNQCANRPSGTSASPVQEETPFIVFHRFIASSYQQISYLCRREFYVTTFHEGCKPDTCQPRVNTVSPGG